MAQRYNLAELHGGPLDGQVVQVPLQEDGRPEQVVGVPVPVLDEPPSGSGGTPATTSSCRRRTRPSAASTGTTPTPEPCLATPHSPANTNCAWSPTTGGGSDTPWVGTRGLDSRAAPAGKRYWGSCAATCSVGPGSRHVQVLPRLTAPDPGRPRSRARNGHARLAGRGEWHDPAASRVVACLTPCLLWHACTLGAQGHNAASA